MIRTIYKVHKYRTRIIDFMKLSEDAVAATFCIRVNVQMRVIHRIYVRVDRKKRFLRIPNMSVSEKVHFGMK